MRVCRRPLRTLAALAALALAACSGESTPPPPTPAAGAPASTAAELAAAVAAAGTVPPPGATRDEVPRAEATSSPESRQARFEARRKTDLPPSLGLGWRRALSTGPGRVTAIAHERHTAWDKAVPFDEVDLEVRFFGDDAASDAGMLRLLRDLKLPAVPDALPETEMQKGDLTWKLERHPLIAPPGEPREIRYALRVTRDPAHPPQQPGCRKPRTLDVPPTTPGWLAPLVSSGSTRRLVAVRDRRGAEGREDSLKFHLLFHNGEAADEMTGRLADAATAAGFRRESGAEGNRQRWRGQNSEKLSFKPTTEDLRLGCRVEGPVTVIEFVRPLDDQPIDAAPSKRSSP